MKYVTRIYPESKLYYFSGSKVRLDFRLHFYSEGKASSIILDQKALARLYLDSRDGPGLSEYKFTGPAHSDMSELIFKGRYLVIRFHPSDIHRSERGNDEEPLYLLGAYRDGLYRDVLLGKHQLNAWMTINRKRSIIFCSSKQHLE